MLHTICYKMYILKQFFFKLRLLCKACDLNNKGHTLSYTVVRTHPWSVTCHLVYVLDLDQVSLLQTARSS